MKVLFRGLIVAVVNVSHSVSSKLLCALVPSVTVGHFHFYSNIGTSGISKGPESAKHFCRIFDLFLSVF